MEKFVLPDAWCCLATNQEEDEVLTDYIIEQFDEDCEYDDDVKGNGWFSNTIISIGMSYHYTFLGKPNNCTEITFQQFKDYVLREKPTDDSNLEAIYLKLLQ